MNENTLPILISVLGRRRVGKTCIIRRICENEFLPNSLPTMGMDFTTKKLVWEDNEKIILFQDQGGADQIQKLLRAFKKELDLIIYVFDAVETADYIPSFKVFTTQVVAHRKLSSLPILVLFNKIDLEYDGIKFNNFRSQVSRAIDPLKRYKLLDVSAKSGYNITKGIEWIMKQMNR